MNNCMLLKENGECDGLNITKKEMDCEHCKFHITKEEYERKEKKIKNWYRRYGNEQIWAWTSCSNK